MKELLAFALGSLVALGLVVVLAERFPALHRGWRARRGRRPFLYAGGEARPSDIVAMLTWTGLGAALALPVSLWWWRSTASRQ